MVRLLPPQLEMQSVIRRVTKRFMGPPRRAEAARMRASVGVVKLDVEKRAPYKSREATPHPADHRDSLSFSTDLRWRPATSRLGARPFDSAAPALPPWMAGPRACVRLGLRYVASRVASGLSGFPRSRIQRPSSRGSPVQLHRLSRGRGRNLGRAEVVSSSFDWTLDGRGGRVRLRCRPA